jgi:hypothetical protein
LQVLFESLLSFVDALAMSIPDALVVSDERG